MNSRRPPPCAAKAMHQSRTRRLRAQFSHHLDWHSPIKLGLPCLYWSGVVNGVTARLASAFFFHLLVRLLPLRSVLPPRGSTIVRIGRGLYERRWSLLKKATPGVNGMCCRLPRIVVWQRLPAALSLCAGRLALCVTESFSQKNVACWRGVNAGVSFNDLAASGHDTFRHLRCVTGRPAMLVRFCG